MDPRLIAGKHLQVATPSRERGVAFVALALLLIALTAVGVAQRGTDPGFDAAAAQPPAPVVVASPVAGTTTIPGTAIPAPADLVITDSRAHGGTHVFLTAPITPEASTALFGAYLTSMPAQGWTLLGKGDPTRAGDWTQRWQAGTGAALLTMTTRPRDTFTVQLCPPDPYC